MYLYSLTFLSLLFVGVCRGKESGAVLVAGFHAGTESYPCASSMIPPFPLELRSPAAAVYNGTMHVCGGWTLDDGFFPSCYKLEGGEWVVGPLLKMARNEHTFTKFGDKMLIVGGLGLQSEYLDTTEVFDGSSWSMSKHRISPDRASHCSVAISDTEVMVIGGQRRVEGSPLLQTISNIDVFDEETGWTFVGRIYPGRFGHACVRLGNEVIVSGGSEQDSRMVQALDLETMQWRDMPQTIEKRWDHTMEVIDGKVYIFGGFWSPNTVEWFDGSDWHLDTLTYEHQDSASAVVSCDSL